MRIKFTAELSVDKTEDCQGLRRSQQIEAFQNYNQLSECSSDTSQLVRFFVPELHFEGTRWIRKRSWLSFTITAVSSAAALITIDEAFPSIRQVIINLLTS